MHSHISYLHSSDSRIPSTHWDSHSNHLNKLLHSHKWDYRSLQLSVLHNMVHQKYGSSISCQTIPCSINCASSCMQLHMYLHTDSRIHSTLWDSHRSQGAMEDVETLQCKLLHSGRLGCKSLQIQSTHVVAVEAYSLD